MPAQATDAPELVFACLAPLIAATRSMWLINPVTNQFLSRARRLSKRLPDLPAAVTFWLRQTRTTTLLVFDLDPKDLGPTAVLRDFVWLRALLVEAGAEVVSDHNPATGGRHLIVPLAHGEALHKSSLEKLMWLLASRLPTLDRAPMDNDKLGAIVPPGSRTRQGGHRILDGTLADAVAVLTHRRVEFGLVARLCLLLGDSLISHSPTMSSSRSSTPETGPGQRYTRGERPIDVWEGEGDQQRLQPSWRGTSAFPVASEAFATSGATVPGRYKSASEWRQSVLCAAALRGMSLAEVRTRMRSDWVGMAATYARYERDDEIDRALRRDWSHACDWVQSHLGEFVRCATHSEREQHTPPVVDHGKPALPTETPHSDWLARATAWTYATWPGQNRRWQVLAVFQALAYAAYVAGRMAPDDTPCVEVGVRSLGLHAGLMAHETVASVLAEVREIPGSPVFRTRRAAGTNADEYSLVTARRAENLDKLTDPVPLERISVVPVHDAWLVLGLHKRAIYELITRTGLTTAADVLAAAHVARSTGQDVLAALARDGLITRSRGSVAPGPISLADIADRHNLHAMRAVRLSEVKQQRAAWRTWLEIRFGLVTDPTTDTEPSNIPAAPWDSDHILNEIIWAAQIAAGPPEPPYPGLDDPPEHDPADPDALALTLLQDQLGAVLLV
ncbi:hypothetical protein [Nocardia ninae]|uniref:hypothetical protein n=1 Tax=Nocardia ninae TaxID=356145 RepID=UPI001649E726|nr:hypothetical protein [Nocardia ninae]